MRYATAIAATLALALAIPVAAFARGPGADGGARKERRARFIKKIKQHRAKMLRQQVGLNEAKAAQVEKILDGFHTRRRALRKDMRAQHKALKQLLAQDSNDQKAFQLAVDAMVATRAQLAKLHDRQIDALRRVLTPKQQAKALMALHKMKRKIRHRMHRMHRKHRRGGRGGPGGPDGFGGPPHDGPGGEHPPPAGADF